MTNFIMNYCIWLIINKWIAYTVEQLPIIVQFIVLFAIVLFILYAVIKNVIRNGE